MTRFTSLALVLLSTGAQAQIGENMGDAVKPIAALTSTPVLVKATRGIVDRLTCYNPNASVAYAQFYDTTSVVTPGVTTSKFFVALTPSTVTNVTLGVNMFNAAQVAGTTTAGGGTAPGSALPCSVTFR